MAFFYGNRFSSAVFVISCVVATNLVITNALKIRNLSVPDRVDFNSSDPLFLDCYIDFNNPSEEYELNSSMVIRWSLNNSLIFQWVITGDKHLFVNSSVHNIRVDDFKHWNGIKPTHMPLTFLRKTVNLTGLYECKVYTAGTLEDTKQKYMHVYSPADEIILKKNIDEEQDMINISCSAEGLYPKPVVSLIVDNKRLENASEYVLQNRGPYYDVNATYSVAASYLPSYTLFNCSISIPEVNWSYSRVITYSKAGYEFGGSNNSSYDQQAQEGGGSPIVCCSVDLIILSMCAMFLQHIFSSCTISSYRRIN